jgi:hypothetical protein
MTSWITPNMEGQAFKQSHLSSPILQHAIAAVKKGVLDKDSYDKEVQSNELGNESVVEPTNTGFNLLILEQDFCASIRDNFCCKYETNQISFC